MRDWVTSAIALIVICTVALSISAQQSSSPDWKKGEMPFRPLGIASQSSTIWVVGTGAGIAATKDGVTWSVRRMPQNDGPMLLGIQFHDEQFGYAYGTDGAILFTSDGGEHWSETKGGSEDILRLSMSDAAHGIVRTNSGVFLFKDGKLTPIARPANAPADFQYVNDVVALSPSKISFGLSEGWRSRTGFVSSIDGGATWSFVELEHIVPYQMLKVGEKYWTIGTETVGYDKHGEGGLGVPLVMSSDDARTWQHTSADIKACNWEDCHICQTFGCLASANLIVNPYMGKVTLIGIPYGHLTQQWAGAAETVCSLDHYEVYCTKTTNPPDPLKSPVHSSPDDSMLPKLGTQEPTGILRCLQCSLQQIYVDQKVSGAFQIQISITVQENGTIGSIAIEGAPSPQTEQNLKEQVSNWLFAPPRKEGSPVTVKTSLKSQIQVIKPR